MPIKKRLLHRCFPVNFDKFLIANFEEQLCGTALIFCNTDLISIMAKGPQCHLRWRAFQQKLTAKALHIDVCGVLTAAAIAIHQFSLTIIFGSITPLGIGNSW